ncbi:flagellar motor protein MotB [Paenibacillus sp. YN15]|uniref:flagellar motor protein MotB n=1 Tax=Paenibacillus sp. YN15 TaxID=1742774 RepID=UPI000DCED4A9|nr:flagellar motor protein MotB [Paenibacillus sp. YN15]RAV05662.1 flagellar motor protein MotB [Paenibacillus sp. YN15]
MAKKQRHEEHEEHADESWLIPYADLMTLLLALFIVLFATAQTDQKKLDQLAKSMSGAFNGGKGFMEFFGIVQPSRNADTESKNTTPADTSGAYKQPDRSEEESESGQSAEEQAEQAAKAEEALKEQKSLNEMKQQMDSFISENNLSTQLDTTLGSHYVMITIRDQAIFASGSAEVKPEAKQLADAISAILTNYPEYQVTVSGHTDNVPITTKTYSSNWDLSTARSLSFMKELFRNANVNQQRFSSTGFGEFKPIASNDTAEGRAKNRRVEVSIISPAVLSGSELPLP